MKVSIIVLNWNQPQLTIDCVNSILNQSFTDYEILIIDNNSSNNSLHRLNKRFRKDPKTRILVTHKNLGYAGGNNFGVHHSLADYVIIQNNDTVVEDGWLTELIDAIESDNSIASVSSLEVRAGEPNRDYSRVGITVNLTGRNIFYEKSPPSHNLPDTFGIKGVSFIYRKSLANPPFDPDYFIYGEDLYLGWLLKLKGYINKLSHHKTRRMHHLHNTSKKSSKAVNKHFIFLGERNRLMNLFIFYERQTLIKLMPLIVVDVMLSNIAEPTKILPRARAYLWFLFNLDKVLSKRHRIQSIRKVSDANLISEMSCKFYDTARVTRLRGCLSIVNNLFFLYCRLVGLNTIEVLRSRRHYV